MVNINDAQKIINTAMKSGGDFAEIYCETKNELAIKYSDEFVEGINTTKIFGIGIYLLRGEKSVYVYTNNVNYDNIQQLAEKASFLISKTQDNYTQKNIVFTDSVIVNPNKYIIKPSNVSHKEKIKILKETAAAAKITERNLKQLDIKYFDSEQNIEIYNSEGLRTGDFRVNSRIRLSATVSSDKGSHGDWGDVTKPQGFEGFKNNNDHVKFAKDFIKDLSLSLNAKPVSSCSVPIVFEGGSCGTFWHETCGHQLESSAVIKDSSDFKDLIGEKVASEKVTLIDDGTLEGMYGSAAIDDEGTPTRKNILIENGILKKYMTDRLGARILNTEPTGNGRRQSYTFAPTARMTNTFLDSGKDDDEEMIKELQKGVFIKKLGGGTGGREFSLEVKEGYWIENGKIQNRLKGLVLNGRGIDIIKKVDRVGRNLENKGGSFCGADSGLCPVTSFQPRMRISNMKIGGE